ncbi:hypothetical protein F5888DRAFT_1610383, partial [Russula emetica]
VAHHCQVCNRLYTTTSALEQHYRDTPVHPKCAGCNIGFVDDAASQAHAASVHRPMASAALLCRICDRTYPNTSALEQHYRDTPVHPKCARCNIGFVDDAAHTASVHRPIASAAFSCRICDRAYPNTSALEQHYRDTPVHPKCVRCNIGFVDNAAVQAVSSLISVSYLGRIINVSTWAKAHRLRPSSNCFGCPLLPYL